MYYQYLQSGMAPIHYAAMKDYIETMAVLVGHGADVNIQNIVSIFSNIIMFMSVDCTVD